MKKKLKQLAHLCLSMMMVLTTVPAVGAPAYADGDVAAVISGNNEPVNYGTLQEAFNAAADGDTVQLLADITAESGFEMDKAGCEIALDLNNHFIKVTGEYENAITVIKGTLKLKDSTIGGSATEHCYYIDFFGSYPIGVVTDSADSDYVNADVKGTFTGGYISADSSGIGLKVYTNDAKGVVLESGTIIGCGYSGINAEGGGNVTMTGGLIAGNYNDCFAGGVVVQSFEAEDEGIDIAGHFEMSGGEIINNYGERRYGGVKLAGANAVLSGDITISDNYWYDGSGDDEHGLDNLSLNHSYGANDMVELGSLAATALIGIRIDAGEDVGEGVFTTGAGSAENAAAAVSNGNFTSDDGYQVSQVTAGTDAGQLQLKAPAVAKNVTQNEEYATLQKALNAANSGDTVVLLKSVKENVVFGGSDTFDGKTVTLNLKGFYIDGSKNRGLSAINVKYGNLVLTDDTTGEHFYYIDESTHLGVIDDTKATAGYTGASVHGSFRGGYVTGADSASGINVDNNCGGSLTLNGGAVIGNKAQYRGGGIYAGGVFTMNGGYVVGNYSSNNYMDSQPNGGGGIVALGKGVKLLGGTIMHNTTASESHGGGGVLAFKDRAANTTVGGTVKIQENWSFNGSKVDNLTIWKSRFPNNPSNNSETLLLLENPASGMKVGVTIFESTYQGGWTTTPGAIGVFTDGVNAANAAAWKKYFSSDNSDYGIKVNDSTEGELAIGEVSVIVLEGVTVSNTTDASRDGSGGESTYPLAGDVLTADPQGAKPVTYQWYRVKDGVTTAITKSTDETYGRTASYTATGADVGANLKVEVTQSVDENEAPLATPIKKSATIGPVALTDAPCDFTLAQPTYPSSTNGQITKNSTPADSEYFENLVYSADGGETWNHMQSNGKTAAADILAPGTYLYRYVDEDGNATSKIATVILEPVNDLTGLKITSTNQNFYNPDVANVLTAVPEYRGTLDGDLEYSWYRIKKDKDGNHETTFVGSGQIYTVTAEDVGCVLLAELHWWYNSDYEKVMTTPTPEIVTVPANLYTVSGTIRRWNNTTETSSSPCNGATVELRRGNTVIATATTDLDGNYTFAQQVPNGDYNIVVTKDDTTKTTKLTVNGTSASGDVILPYYNVSSTVVVQGNVPAIVVGSLDQIAEEQSDGVLGPGSDVEVKLVVEGKADLTTLTDAEAEIQLTEEQKVDRVDQQEVKTLAQDTIGDGTQVEFVDMGMTMSVTSAGNTTTTKIVDTGGNILGVSIPYNLEGKYSVGVFRKHVDEAGNATVEALQKSPSGAEGTFWLGTDEVNTSIGKFSTYAIAYTTTPPDNGGGGGGNGGGSGSDGGRTSSTPAVQTPVVDQVTTATPKETGVADWLITDDHIVYLSGYDTDGVKTIRPSGNITRAEVAMIFYRLLLDKDPAAAKDFTDVKDGAWYAKAVRVLASRGIISGYTDGSFRPDDPISRAEFTAIATRFAKATEGKTSFTDVSASHWAYSSIATAAGYGWVNGYSDGSFVPAGKITRGEVAAIVNRMLGRVADQDYINANSGKLANFTDLTPGLWCYYDMVEAANAHDFEFAESRETWK